MCSYHYWLTIPNEQVYGLNNKLSIILKTYAFEGFDFFGAIHTSITKKYLSSLGHAKDLMS